VLLALSRYGRHDLALKLARRTAVPSWGNQIESGATTTWDRWDGFVPGRGFQDPKNNSFDSVAFGSVGEWMMRAIGGIELDDAHATSGPVRLMPILDGPTRSSAEGPRAFEHFFLRPRIEGGVTWARAEHASIAGRIAVSWSIAGNVLTYDCTIPPNTRATLELPAQSRDAVEEGELPIAEVRILDVRRFEGGRVVIEVPAGTYHFTSRIG
jgi:alpha-L-rhamnosidase